MAEFVMTKEKDRNWVETAYVSLNEYCKDYEGVDRK